MPSTPACRPTRFRPESRMPQRRTCTPSRAPSLGVVAASSRMGAREAPFVSDVDRAPRERGPARVHGGVGAPCVYPRRVTEPAAEDAPPTSADLELGAFTANGPWVIQPERLVWNRGLTRVRARTRAEVPRLLARRRIPPVAR